MEIIGRKVERNMRITTVLIITFLLTTVDIHILWGEDNLNEKIETPIKFAIQTRQKARMNWMNGKKNVQCYNQNIIFIFLLSLNVSEFISEKSPNRGRFVTLEGQLVAKVNCRIQSPTKSGQVCYRYH
jgi:hypothetical protein